MDNNQNNMPPKLFGQSPQSNKLFSDELSLEIQKAALPERSIGEAVADFGVSAAETAATGVTGLARLGKNAAESVSLISEDTSSSIDKSLEGADQFISDTAQKGYSENLLKKRDIQQQEMASMDEWERTKYQIGQAFNPANLPETLGAAAGFMIPGTAGAKALSVGAKALGGAKVAQSVSKAAASGGPLSKSVNATVQAAPSAISYGALSGGAQQSKMYEDAYNNAIESGMDEDSARQVAANASKDWQATAASAAVGGLGGVFGAERQIARLAGIAGGKASQGLGGIARSAAATAGSEALQEGAEGFVGEVGSNIAQQRQGLQAETFDNALSSAAVGAASGAVTGGVLGGATAGIKSPAQSKQDRAQRIKELQQRQAEIEKQSQKDQVQLAEQQIVKDVEAEQQQLMKRQLAAKPSETVQPAVDEQLDKETDKQQASVVEKEIGNYGRESAKKAFESNTEYVKSLISEGQKKGLSKEQIANQVKAKLSTLAPQSDRDVLFDSKDIADQKVTKKEYDKAFNTELENSINRALGTAVDVDGETKSPTQVGQDVSSKMFSNGKDAERVIIDDSGIAKAKQYAVSVYEKRLGRKLDAKVAGDKSIIDEIENSVQQNAVKTKALVNTYAGNAVNQASKGMISDDGFDVKLNKEQSNAAIDKLAEEMRTKGATDAQISLMRREANGRISELVKERQQKLDSTNEDKINKSVSSDLEANRKQQKEKIESLNKKIKQAAKAKKEQDQASKKEQEEFAAQEAKMNASVEKRYKEEQEAIKKSKQEAVAKKLAEINESIRKSKNENQERLEDARKKYESEQKASADLRAKQDKEQKKAMNKARINALKNASNNTLKIIQEDDENQKNFDLIKSVTKKGYIPDDAVAVPRSEFTGRLNAATKFLDSIGVKYVVMDTKEDLRYGGFYRRDLGIIVLNKNAKSDLLSIALHESFHSLPESSRIEAVNAVYNTVPQSEIDKFKQLYPDYAKLPEMTFKEEVVAKIIEKDMKNPEFWEALNKEMPSGTFKEFIAGVLRYFGKLKEALSVMKKTPEVISMSNDIDKVRSIVAKAYAKGLYEDLKDDPGYSLVDGELFSLYERNLVDIPEITVKDLVGKKITPIKADLMDAGRNFEGLGDVVLQFPVELMGGPNYPRLPENYSKNVVWASKGNATTSKVINRANDADYVIVLAMNEDSHLTNFTTTQSYFRLLLEYVKQGKVSAENVKEIEKQLLSLKVDGKQFLKEKNFKSLSSEKTEEILDSLTFDQRGLIVNHFRKASVKALGVPNIDTFIGETIDPDFAGYNSGDAMLVIEVDKSDDPKTRSEKALVKLGEDTDTKMHPSYPYGIRGKVVGKMSRGVNYKLLFEDYMAEIDSTTDKNGNPMDPWYLLDRKMPIQEVKETAVAKSSKSKLDFAKNFRTGLSGIRAALGQWSGDTKALLQKTYENAMVSNASPIPLLEQSKKKTTILKRLGFTADDQPRIFFAQKPSGDTRIVLSAFNNEPGVQEAWKDLIIDKAIEDGATLFQVLNTGEMTNDRVLTKQDLINRGFEVEQEFDMDPIVYTTTPSENDAFFKRYAPGVTDKKVAIMRAPDDYKKSNMAGNIANDFMQMSKKEQDLYGLTQEESDKLKSMKKQKLFSMRSEVPSEADLENKIAKYELVIKNLAPLKQKTNVEFAQSELDKALNLYRDWIAAAQKQLLEMRTQQVQETAKPKTKRLSTEKMSPSSNVERDTDVSPEKAAQVASWMAKMDTKKLGNVIVICKNVSDLEGKVDGIDWNSFDRNGTHKGMYDPDTDTIYLFSDNISSEKDLRELIAHEATHRGFDIILNAEDNARLERFATSVSNKQEWFRNAMKTAQSEGRFAPDAPMHVKMHETLAMLAEDPNFRQGKVGNFIQSTLGFIRNILRSAAERFAGKKAADALFKEINNAEMLYLLNKARRVGMSSPKVTSDVNGKLQTQVLFSMRGTPMEQVAQHLTKDGLRSLANDTATRFGEILFNQKQYGEIPGSKLLNMVQTQYNKAQKSPQFRKVFEAIQKKQTDENNFAHYLMSKAPSWFFEAEKVPQSFKDFTKQVKANAQNVIGEGNAQKRKKFEDFMQGFVFQLDEENNNIRFSKDQMMAVNGYEDGYFEAYEQMLDTIHSSIDLTAVSTIKNVLGTFSEMADGRFDFKDLIDNLEPSVNGKSNIENVKAAADRSISQIRENLDPKEDKELLKILKNFETQITETLDFAQKARDTGYFPFERFGRYNARITVKSKDGELLEKQMAFFMSDSISDLESQIKEYEAKMSSSGNVTEVTRGTQSDEMGSFFNISAMTSILDQLKRVDEDLMKTDEGKAIRRQIQEQSLRVVNEMLAAQNSLLLKKNRRKGVIGQSNDLQRITSNFTLLSARDAANLENASNISGSIAEIPAQMGATKDEAISLARYVSDPKEEAQELRSLLYFWNIGGSLSSALMQFTQPLLMTIPRMAAYASTKDTTKYVMNAMKMAMNGKYGDISDDIGRLIAEGKVSAQETSMLMAIAKNSKFRGSKAMAGINLWSSLFGYTETVNRIATAVSAIQMWKDNPMFEGTSLRDKFLREQGDFVKGLNDRQLMDTFVKTMIDETQGIYNKGNRVNWGRGALGASAMTFRQFLIMYVELLARMPWRQRAIALGALAFLGGGFALPFSDDITDVVDGAGQLMGYNTNSKKLIRDFLSEVTSDSVADMITYGASSILPLDFSGRVAMSNLVPGTGFFKQAGGQSFEQASMEFLGVPASFFKSVSSGSAKLVQGDVYGAVRKTAPIALSNLLRGGEILATGEIRDGQGRVRATLNGTDRLIQGVSKAAGFNPQANAALSRVEEDVRQSVEFRNKQKTKYINAMSEAYSNGDMAKIEEIKREIAQWNKRNMGEAGFMITFKMSDIIKKANLIKMGVKEKLTTQGRLQDRELYLNAFGEE